MTSLLLRQTRLIFFILFCKGRIKKSTISLYQERRFTKRGYTVASILDVMPYLQMLVNESHLANQHIETACMFLDCEFLITNLFALAYFTHPISLPLLNFVEISITTMPFKGFSTTLG